MDAYAEAIDLLGGGTVFKPSTRSLEGLRRSVTQGLPIESVDKLLARLPSGERATWREYIVRSSKSEPKSKRLTVEASDRVARLAYVLALAHEVWGSWADAVSFLERSHSLLGGASPLSAAQTEVGARAVEQMLRNIEFGMPV